jgi:hypothetical protein
VEGDYAGGYGNVRIDDAMNALTIQLHERVLRRSLRRNDEPLDQERTNDEPAFQVPSGDSSYSESPAGGSQASSAAIGARGV